MTFRLCFNVISILPVIVSIVTSDSDWFGSDEPLAPENGFVWDDEVHEFDQPALPFDLASSIQDGFGSLFGDMEGSDLFASDDDGIGESFELAACSSSELFPAIGKSRMRRRDGSAACMNPASTPQTGTLPPFDAARDPFATQGMTRLLGDIRFDRPANSACEILTWGVLPVGVCHSGAGALPTNIIITIGSLSFEAVDLQYCSICMFEPKFNLT